MKRLLLASSVVLGTGCAGTAESSAAPSQALLDAQAASRRAEALEAENRAHRDRIQQLEGQLALARAEVTELRAAAPAAAFTETVRIGEAAADEGWVDRDDVPVGGLAIPDVDDAPSEPEDDGGPRPVLRLYGSPAAALDGESVRVVDPGAGAFAMPAPPLPPIARAPAPVPMPAPAPAPMIPQAPIPVATAPVAPAAAGAPNASVAVERYRAALEHVRNQRLAEALAGLTAFVEEFPSHPYADNALYWRGEVHYAMRRYADALRDFQRVVREHPRGNKVPDALLKIGLCHARMGDIARARAYFRRVRNEYPESVAARLASQEDAS